MKDFLIEIKKTDAVAKIKDNSKVLLTGSTGNKFAAVVLSISPQNFNKPDSTFVHIKFSKDPPAAWFMEGVKKLVTEDYKNEFPILGVTELR